MNWQGGCFLVFLGLFYIVGFVLLGQGVWGAYRSREAASWPTVPGKIIHSEVQEKSDSDGDKTYEVIARYSYSVDNVAYEGSRLAFGYSASSNRSSHAEIQAKLAGAQAVAVRYDPDDPAKSCLSFGFHRSIKVKLLFGVIWLVFIFGFTLLIWLSGDRDNVLLNNLAVE